MFNAPINLNAHHQMCAVFIRVAIMLWRFIKQATAAQTTHMGRNKTQQLSSAEPELKTLKDLMREYWQEYCSKSSIHGVRYLYDPSVRYLGRLIWSALVITSIVLTCIACVTLAERYNSQKLETVVEDSQYPVFPIQFPAVAVCTHTRINWNKMQEAREIFLPVYADSVTVQVFDTFVKRLEKTRFGYFESFAEMEDINLEALNFLDVSKLVHFLAPTCEDIFLNGSCTWRKLEFECCERFIMERTEWGYCLVFNSELSGNSRQLKFREGAAYYPYHNSKAGQRTGLNFVLEIDDKMKKPNSTANEVMIMIKKPDQWSDSGYSLTPNTQSYVIVRPEITDPDTNLYRLTPEQRNCLFLDETTNYKSLKGFNYRQNNCLNVCHEEHLIEYCNCTLQFFFPNNNEVNPCKAADFRCLAKNTDVFSYDKRREEDAFFSSIKPGMTCYCLVSCNTVQYFTSLTTLPMEKDELTPNTSLFMVDVHYQAEVMVKYHTSLKFTSIDLIANFGGIFGLCMGASMVSAVELLYYLTIGFGLYLYDNSYHKVLRMQLRNFWRRSMESNSSASRAPFKLESQKMIHKHKPAVGRYHTHDRKNAW